MKSLFLNLLLLFQKLVCNCSYHVGGSNFLDFGYLCCHSLEIFVVCWKYATDPRCCYSGVVSWVSYCVRGNVPYKVQCQFVWSMAIVHAYVCIVFKKSHETFPIATWLGIRPVPNYFLNCTNFILLDC